MRRVLVLGSALSFLVSCAAAPVSPPPLDDEPREAPTNAAAPFEDVRALSHLSGLDARVGALVGLPQLVARSVREAAMRSGEHKPTIDENLIAVLDRARKTHSETALRTELEAALFALDDEGRARAAARYLASEAHKRVQEQLDRALTPVGQKALGAFLATLPAAPPDPERLARARATVAASREVDLTLALTYDASRAFLEGALGTADEETRARLAPHLAVRPGERASFRARVERSVVLRTYFAARFTPDRHSIRELAFWRSSVGQWLSTSRLKAARATLSAQNRALFAAPPR